jgi:hypothetical protein
MNKKSKICKKAMVSCLISSLIFISMLTTGCANQKEVSNNQEVTQTKDEPKPVLTKQEFQQLYSDIEKFKGKSVDFYARIFVTPDKDDKGTYIQAYANNDNNKNTFIAIKDSNIDFKNGDIIHVIGVVDKKIEGKNTLGSLITMPIIVASIIEKSDYTTAFSTSIKTFNINEEQNQNGYVVKIKKVELAEKETRVYLSVINSMIKDSITLYTSDVKLVQGSTQLVSEYNHEANYPEMNHEFLPGITDDGILSYKPIDLNGETLKIIINGSCNNYDIKIKPFIFEIPLK